jgi:hypothetical protein
VKNRYVVCANPDFTAHNRAQALKSGHIY